MAQGHVSGGPLLQKSAGQGLVLRLTQWPHAPFWAVRNQLNGSLLNRKFWGSDFVATELSLWWTMSPKGGEEMSKGNFLDFVEEASGPNASLRKDFHDALYTPGATAEGLMKFFHDRDYYDVSLDDCRKMLSVPKQGSLDWDIEKKY